MTELVDRADVLAAFEGETYDVLTYGQVRESIRALPSQTVQAGSESAPVAWQWRIPTSAGGSEVWSTETTKEKAEQRSALWPVTEIRPLYAAPPPAVPVDAIGVVEEVESPPKTISDTQLPQEALDAWVHYEPVQLGSRFYLGVALLESTKLRHAFMSGFLASLAQLSSHHVPQTGD